MNDLQAAHQSVNLDVGGTHNRVQAIAPTALPLRLLVVFFFEPANPGIRSRFQRVGYSFKGYRRLRANVAVFTCWLLNSGRFNSYVHFCARREFDSEKKKLLGSKRNVI